MKIQVTTILLAISAVLLSADLSQASCNPCVCGPGGDFQSDLSEWWQDNCPWHFPGNIGTKSFIGHYKAVGACKLIQGNRTMERMEIEPAYDWAKLPKGSLVVTFHRYEDFNNDYFSTFVIPGSGTIKAPESPDKNPVQMSYSTEFKNGMTSQNILCG